MGNVDQAKAQGQEETEAQYESTGGGKYDIDLILDIPLDVTVEFGSVKLLVNDLLQLGQGSVIELEKPVGELLDIFVNDRLIAKGEVVVLEDKFGIRISDIINPTERIKSLA